MLFQLPRSCRVFCAYEPANQWGWGEVFANKTTHLLELLLWQAGTPSKKGERARHKANKPKPFMPDFMKRSQAGTGMNESVEAMTVDDVKSWLAVPRTGS